MDGPAIVRSGDSRAGFSGLFSIPRFEGGANLVAGAWLEVREHQRGWLTSVDRQAALSCVGRVLVDVVEVAAD